MKIIETILQQIGNLSKPKQKFILGLFSTIFIVCGQVNFTNASRYSKITEKTYRRHFSQPFPFSEFNYYLIKEALKDNSTQILAIDCSFIPKSGKSTYGLDYFFNSCVGKAKKGLEISVISVVDVEKHQAYTLSDKLTPPQNSDSGEEVPVDDKKQTSQKKRGSSKKKSRNRRKKKLEALETTRIDLYLAHLKNTPRIS